MPLGRGGATRGVLLVARYRGRPRFSDVEVGMAATFADHAAIALELSDARADQQRMVLLEDRDRIARDLHDHVIQRLFAAGLSIQRVTASIRDPAEVRRLSEVVDEIDETIRQIRTTIFRLRGPLSSAATPLREQLLTVIDASATGLGFAPTVRFIGPLDSTVPVQLVDDTVAVVREALSNVTKHAAAGAVDIVIGVEDGRLLVTVADDGAGMRELAGTSGLANLRSRAERHGGTFTVTSPADAVRNKGTQLTWTIPLATDR
jgi:signal transduction histidine kinase